MLTEGELAPEFELNDLTGKRWSLRAELKSGPILLAFFKIACPTCQLTAPFLQRLADGEGPSTPHLVAISQDDAAATQGFLDRFRVALRTLVDPAKAFPASNAYRITHVPSLFLIEPDGRISLAADGFSKAHLEELGRRFGLSVFHPQDRIPSLQPG